MAECETCKHYAYKEICKDCHSNNVLYEPYKGSGWISVKDRLPEKRKKYLVVTAGGQVAILWYLAKEDDLADCFEFPNGAWVRCTHWMPLPEPPEGE